MKIQAAEKISTPGKSTLIAVFISKPGRNAVETELSDYSKHLPELPEKIADRREKHLSQFMGRPAVFLGLGETPNAEDYRRATHQAVTLARDFSCAELVFIGASAGWSAEEVTAIAEAVQLSNYQYLAYFSEPHPTPLATATLICAGDWVETALARAEAFADAACIARDLVNEPPNSLTAVGMARQIENLGQRYGFGVEVLEKAQIQSLKMGGLLAVNAGSQLPPTFTIMDYAPEGTADQKPIILVGKGVVFDTGGLSLKPTPNSMDYMKCDMGGAAAVIGAVCGVAMLGLKRRVIGLIPATDNRPGENAYLPGDVIKMFDGSTVEVLNTDAEGRMILADALGYAKRQYDPEIVVDLATLTGAAVIATGWPGIPMMGTASEAEKEAFKNAGERVFERLVELPLWEEYGEMLKSDIADLKNIGGREAGSITAGKFLEHFTDYPWIHLDIAGSAWLSNAQSYRGKNGTGVGVRLLMAWLEAKTATKG